MIRVVKSLYWRSFAFVVVISLLALSVLGQVNVFAVNDFSISTSPSTLNVAQGSSGTTTVIIDSIDNFSSPVTLSVSGLPSGAIAGFGTNPVTPPLGGSASSPLIVSVGSSVPVATYPLIVTGSNGTISHSASLTLKVFGSGDFSLTVVPTNVLVAPSSYASATVTVVSSGSFTSPVSLTTSGTPPGLTLTYGPNPVAPPAGGSASSLVTLTVSPFATTGIYTITIVGTSGSVSHSTTLSVAISQTGYADFALSASPTTVSIVQGTSGATTLTVTSINSFNSPVGLSVGWVGSAPSGVTFSYATIVSPPPGGTTAVTFTVAASSSASTGTFTFRVTGASGFLRHSIDLTLQVSSSTRDFTLALSPTSLSIVQGSESYSTLTVQSIGSFASGVTLTSSGAPSGMTVTFGTNPVTPSAGGSASSSVTISTSSSLAAGSYGIAIIGGSSSLSHSALLTIVINQAIQPDFSVISSSDAISLTPGASGAVTITVISRNGFNSPVMLFASWLSGAPEDTVFSLPSPVTPLRDGTAVSILRVTTSSSASLGNFTLRILGVNGGLSHYVDVAIRIRSQCIIATASYGSELAPEVQLLKMFRDSMLLKTFAGSTFMTAFNTWYYSFSPNVAGYIADNPATTTSMRLALYPMIMILKLGAATFTVANGSPEAAAVLSGFVISGLIGAVYLTVPISILLSRARSRRIATRLEHVMLGTVLGSGFGIIFAELLQASLMLMLVTPAFVLAVMTLSGLLASRFLMSICSFLGKRYLV